MTIGNFGDMKRIIMVLRLANLRWSKAKFSRPFEIAGKYHGIQSTLTLRLMKWVSKAYEGSKHETALTLANTETRAYVRLYL